MSDTIPISELHPDTRNARKHDARNREAIEKSLTEVGAARSIVIDEADTILAGNATVEAAAKVGIERVRVVEVEGDTLVAVKRTGLTPAQKKRLAVLDNRTAELGAWDAEVLREMIGEGLDFSDLFNPEELAAVLAGEAEEGGLLPGVDPDELPDEEAVETRCKKGDLWQLGRHRLLCADSREASCVETLMAGVTPSMVWADPPYGISVVNVKTGHGRDTDTPGFHNKGKVGVTGVTPAGIYPAIIGDETIETAQDTYHLLAALFPSSIHIWWGANFYSQSLPNSPHWIIWDKQTDGNQFADAELAWTNRTGALRQFRHQWMGMLRDSEHGQKRVHPTQKPVALAEWAFEKYGAKDDTILDPFVGSGMSYLAAEKTGRSVCGMELSEEYCDIILTRWEAATGKKAERL
jgi:hypothetical protein